MGRLYLTPGTRYLRDGRVYVVRQLLLDGRLLVEDQSVGGQTVVARDELTAAWGEGTLTFEVHGPWSLSAVDTSLSTTYTISDFQQLPEAQRAEAWRRYALIRPLLALPTPERTRRAIERYLADARARQEVGAEVGVGAVSRTSVERYLHAFEASGGDIRSLVPATLLRGGADQPRLDAELEGIVQGVLAECRAAPAYRTVRDVYLMVVNRVRDANLARPATDALSLPGQTTIYRRVRAIDATAVLRHRPGRAAVQADASVRPGPRPVRPLERVELDHTPLDLIVVDEEDRLPIGRPTVTLALDVYSGLPTGLHVGFEPAGYAAAARCLLHAILPKEDARARYGTTHLWPVYGLPETLVVDHAPHLVGGDLGGACGQLGIRLDPSPVKRPWFKGAIERQFRTHNTGLVHTLPGTTFSSVLQRGEYDAEGQACIALTRFREILHVYLLDIYAQDWNRGVGGVPATRWAEAVATGWAPALHHDAAEARILLGRTAVRTIQRAGIDLLCLRYQSQELSDLRHALPRGTPVTVKYDPEDLGMLYVRDARAERRWLPVPAIDQSYAGNLSLWKHRVIQGYVRRAMGREVDVYALADAKARIQGLVEDEFRRTRRGRRRMAGARFLGVGAVPPVSVLTAPSTSALPSRPATRLSPGPAPASVDAAARTAAVDRDAPDPADEDAAARAAAVDRDAPNPGNEAGWGADYGLPREGRRDSWR